MKEKNNNIFVVIIVILSILLIISIGYTIYDKIESSKTQDEEIKMLTQQEAQELFEKIVKDPIIEFAFPTKTGELKVSDMDNNQIGAIIYANMSETDKYEICNTVVEDELIDLGIISKSGEGQYDCTVSALSLDKIKEISKSIFGEDYEFIPTQTADNDASFYYYEKRDIVIFRYAGATYNDYVELKDYKLENDTAVLNIETNFPAGEGYEKDNYKLRFKLDDDNYYFYSIEKLD